MPNIFALRMTDYPGLSMPAILVTLCIFIFMAIAYIVTFIYVTYDVICVVRSQVESERTI